MPINEYKEIRSTICRMQYLDKDVLQEHFVQHYQAQGKVSVYDKRIKELSRSEGYQEPVNKLGCFIGTKTIRFWPSAVK